MKLYSSPATPFGRKAAIVAREHGIALDIEHVNPFTSGELEQLNPIKVIPVLVLDDGTALYDSSAPISTTSVRARRSTPRQASWTGSAV